MENIVINASKGLILRKGRALILQRSLTTPPCRHLGVSRRKAGIR